MFFTDWEGPWILTDFAFELTAAIFNNDRFFKNLSIYDDYLAYEVKREGYEAGYTLKLLVPFLAAAGVRNEDLAKIARDLAHFVPDSKFAMNFLQKRWRPIVISTSYLQYLKTTAHILGVDGDLHGTEIDFDSVEIDEDLKKDILDSVDVIASLVGDELYLYLDEFFKRKEIKKLMDDIHAIGAGEKARILQDYCRKYEIDCPVAVGDSISDYKMFESARKSGGVAVAFNGNRYAIEHADIAVVSDSAVSEAAVVFLIKVFGIDKVKRFENLPEKLKKLLDRTNTEIFIVREHDVDEVVAKSQKMRVKLRGEAGKLG